MCLQPCAFSMRLRKPPTAVCFPAYQRARRVAAYLHRSVVTGAADQPSPAVEDRQDRVAWLGQQHDDDPGNAHVAVAGEFVGVLGRVEQGDRQGLRVAPGVARHFAELFEHIERARARPAADRAPAVAIADRPSCRLRPSAADQDRRMRLLHRFWPGHDLVKIDHVAVIFGLGLGPDLLHRLDPLAHQLEAGLGIGAVIFHLVGIPAAADAEQKAPARDLVDRGDEFRCLDRVALLHQAHAGPELEPGCGDRGGSQRHERVHRVVIPLWQFSAARKRRFARGRDVRVLGRPDQFKPPLLQRLGEVDRRDRVIGKEHQCAKIHFRSFRLPGSASFGRELSRDQPLPPVPPKYEAPLPAIAPAADEALRLSSPSLAPDRSWAAAPARMASAAVTPPF